MSAIWDGEIAESGAHTSPTQELSSTPSTTWSCTMLGEVLNAPLTEDQAFYSVRWGTAEETRDGWASFWEIPPRTQEWRVRFPASITTKLNHSSYIKKRKNDVCGGGMFVLGQTNIAILGNARVFLLALHWGITPGGAQRNILDTGDLNPGWLLCKTSVQSTALSLWPN